MSLFGPSDVPVVREILEGNQRLEREGVWRTAVFSPRQVRDEDVRALALEFEERESARREAYRTITPS